MVLLFIPGVFINFICQKKKKKEILLYDHIFIKLNHFSYIHLSTCLFLISLLRDSRGKF